MDSKIEAVKLKIIKMRGLAPHSIFTLQSNRLDICSGCEKQLIYLGIKQCKHCGCFLELKTLVTKEKCPLNKW